MADESYENALRAAREVWEPDSPDFARRDVLDVLTAHWLDAQFEAALKKLQHGMCRGMGWIRLRKMVGLAAEGEDWVSLEASNKQLIENTREEIQKTPDTSEIK